jgi:hypothetical protein
MYAVLPLLLLLIVPRFSRAQTVSEAWLDSLNSNLWRLDSDSLGYAARLVTTTEEYDGDWELKDASTTYGELTWDEEGRRVRRQFDDDGEIEEEQVIGEGDQETPKPGEEGFAMNPFAAFHKEYRSVYDVSLAGTDETGNPVLKLEPHEEGFRGTMSIDTSLWAPLVVKGTPDPMPRFVKEMNVKMKFEPTENGAVHLTNVDTKVYAKVLLLKYRMKIHARYEDYELVRPPGGALK